VLLGGEISNTLQKAIVDVVDNLLCATNYNSSIKVTDGITLDILCAGDSRNWAKDTCQGDSGGPLQIIHPNNSCIYQVIGITSFGKGCATINIPAVYTRVSHYVQWIEKNVWPEGQ
jgi:secreted trypsin-like serine protease